MRKGYDHGAPQETTDRTECDDYRGISLVAHACKLLLTVVANRLGESCKRENILPEEQYVFRPQRSTVGVTFVIRRLYQLAPKKRNIIYMCLVDASRHTIQVAGLYCRPYLIISACHQILSGYSSLSRRNASAPPNDHGECLGWFDVRVGPSASMRACTIVAQQLF